MTNEFILTFDIGTTGNKCTIFNIDGTMHKSVTVPYNTIYPKPGWSEQNPEDFWASAVKGTGLLLEGYSTGYPNIVAIGLSGHMNGCIPIDDKGNVLFNDIIHSDCRSGSQCAKISSVIGSSEFYSITGNRLDPHYTLPKILWLMEHYPEIYRRTAYFINSKDYLSYKLTGNLGITDYSDASLTCMLDITNKRWSGELIDNLGISGDKLPRLCKSSDIAGYLTPEAAALLGLRSGIPVAVGGGDGACATRGAGVAAKGQAYNYIGSSSWISTLNDKPLLDSDARIFNFYDLDGRNCNVTGTVQSAASSYDWVLNNLGKYECEEARIAGKNVFDCIDDLARGVPEGSNGVYFLPYLMGERTPYWDENTKDAFIGFTLYNNRNDMFRSVYEGVAYALRSVLDVFRENALKVDVLTLIGGGAKSRLWNEIMCNVYGTTVKVHKQPGEATSIGAAIAAGVSVGVYKNFEVALNLIDYDREYSPVTEKSSVYSRFYQTYKMMYPHLKPIFDVLSEQAQT